MPEFPPEPEPEFGLDLLLKSAAPLNSAPATRSESGAAVGAEKPARGREPIDFGMLAVAELLNSSAEAPLRAGGRGGGGGGNEEDAVIVAAGASTGCVAEARERNPSDADVDGA